MPDINARGPRPHEAIHQVTASSIKRQKHTSNTATFGSSTYDINPQYQQASRKITAFPPPSTANHNFIIQIFKNPPEMCQYENIHYGCGHAARRLIKHCHFARNDPNHQCFGAWSVKREWSNPTEYCRNCAYYVRQGSYGHAR
ncbi:hypothetical protein E4T44_05917 [Aureobasidium sp. EXF-8845]|nr:hypothetical protein E4T44_05917 [Aureobasidium sp. EXF-8845]KAI4849578.1 hypothetical protein E4T45_05862 [Aureobasidium sp. EXF-8846]